jgi:hypothetical protein
MTAAADVRAVLRPSFIAHGRAPHTPHRTPPSMTTDWTAIMTTTTRGMIGDPPR